MRDKTTTSTKKSARSRRGALSSTVMKRVRPALSEDPAPSKKAVPRWLVIAALLLTAGVVFAALIGQKRELAGPGAMVNFLLSPTVETEPMASPDTSAIRLTGRLRSRSSFTTEAAFQASESYRTLLLASRALPLAIHCKDVPSLRAIKVVLGVISESDPYHAEMMARRYISQQPDRFRYRQQDCAKTLPNMMAELRERV